MANGSFSAPDSPGGVLPGSERADLAHDAASAMANKWAVLNDAAFVVATLAGLAPEPRKTEAGNFPAQLGDAYGWRKTLAERGVDDLAAVMEPGIAALLAAQASGVVPASAALALWQEFARTRAAMLALVAGPDPGIPRCA